MALSHANSLKLYLSFPTVEWRKRLLIYFIWSEMAFIWISVRMKKASEPVWSALLLSILSPLIILPVPTLHMWKRNLRKARSTLFKVTELVNHRIRTERWVFWYHWRPELFCGIAWASRSILSLRSNVHLQNEPITWCNKNHFLYNNIKRMW